MIAEILCVGTEILLGQIVNTNAQFLARELAALGIGSYHQSVVGDNEQRLTEQIELSLSRCDLLIATGGLGPTADDITKETIAKTLGLPMERDEESVAKMEAFFAKNGKGMTPNNLKQADFPVGSTILPNDKGTAPGCIIEKDGKIVIILPGPPFELQPMFLNYAAPYLAAKSEKQLTSRMLRLFEIGESRCEYVLSDLMQGENPTLAPYAGFGEVTLRLTAFTNKGEDPTPLLDELENKVRERVGEYIYATGNEKLETVTARMLCERNLTLGVAESLTGGEICARLIDYPGISQSLLEGCVTYSNEAKVNTLGVKEATLAAYGAVSEQTALEMAQGMRARCGADLAVATTGIAGPGGGSEEKPVGLVYVAVAGKNGYSAVRKLTLGGDRERVRKMSTLYALDGLRRAMLAMDKGENK